MSRDILQCDTHGEFLACGPHYSCPQCWEAKNTIMKPAEAEILSVRYALVSSLFKAIAAGLPLQVRRDDTDGSTINWEDFEVCVGEAIDVNRPEYYRVKPQPVLTPWRNGEGPNFFMVRLKSADATSDPLVCRKFSKYPNEFGVSLLSGMRYLSGDDLMREFVRVRENGLTDPCGIMETPS